MSDKTDTRNAAALKLEDDLELDRVQFVELRSKILTVEEFEALRSQPKPAGNRLNIHVAFNDESEELAIRLRVVTFSEDVLAEVDCIGSYSKPKTDYEIDRDAVAEFFQYRAGPDILPFVREAIAESTRRITGRALMLRQVRPAGLKLHDYDSGD